MTDVSTTVRYSMTQSSFHYFCLFSSLLAKTEGVREQSTEEIFLPDRWEELHNYALHLILLW
jgi:hypothetical protein